MKKWECTVCGYIHEGEEPPEECPVCSADKSMFVEVVEEPAQATASTGRGPQATAKPAASAAPQTLLAKVHGLASKLIGKHHLHPIMVHTPNGVLPMALIFLVISVLFAAPQFASAALFSFVFVLVSMPLVLYTGYVMWQRRYRGALTSVFKIKIGASLCTVLLLLTLIIWRLAQPEVLVEPSAQRWIYLGLSVLMVGAVGLAGHFGGKLVFGSRRD